MDRLYISSANANEYKKFIGYVQNPVKAFEQYVNNIKVTLVDKLESV